MIRPRNVSVVFFFILLVCPAMAMADEDAARPAFIDPGSGPPQTDTVGSLTTLFASNNSFAGNIFDIQNTTTTSVTITGWRVNLDNPGSTNTVDIYWRNGTANGFQNSSAGWSTLGSDPDVVSNGLYNPTPVTMPYFTINPGEIFGFYVDLASYETGVTALQYTNGPSTVFSNGELALTTHHGMGTPVFTGGTFDDRMWNGTVIYEYGGGNVNTYWNSGLTQAWGIAFDTFNGTVWVSSPGPDWGGNNTMNEYTPFGVPTGRSHPYPWAPANGPADLAYNMNTGMIWVMNVTTGDSNCLYEMSPASGYTGNTICPGGATGWVTSQRGLAYDPITDTFFAGGWNEGIVYHIDTAGNDVETPVTVGIAIAGMAYNPDTHHLFVIDGISSVVSVLDTRAGYQVANQFVISQDFGASAAAGLGIDCDGQLWAVDQTLEHAYHIDSAEVSSFCSLLFADGFESGDTTAW